jgi:type IV pilus assembly protein PilY1
MNRIQAKTQPALSRAPHWHDRWWAAPAAFLATLLALPVHAGIVIPDDPLTSAGRVPPNVMFILDNSGSMASVSMPACHEPQNYTGTGVGCDDQVLGDNVSDRAYLNNTIYYNPSVTYRPWMTADGITRMTGGTTVSSVYENWNQASSAGGTRDLRNSSESVFYVPKAGVTASTNVNDFDRYQVRNMSGTAKVMRGTGNNIVLDDAVWNNRDIGELGSWFGTFDVPAGTTSLRIRARNGTGSNSNADLYVRFGANPSPTVWDYRDVGSGNNEEVLIEDPQVGTWHILVYNSASGSGNRSVNDEDIDATAYKLDLEEATPTGRTQAAELLNIATWYSYYRTRLKTAKGGASEAFANLGRLHRVGYTPINGRSSDLSATGTGPIIPVNTNDGLFETANKTAWFNRVQTEVVQAGSTPLRQALNAVGQYYRRSDTNGPWADSEGAQLACRQSFSILTTDGYWNQTFSSSIGDSDGDGRSVTLADVASYYYKTDLSTLANKVPVSPSDDANWQHMVTFGISIGLQGTMPITDPPPAPNSALWTNPRTDLNTADIPERIDDLWHAAVNSKGEFVVANDPDTFARSLKAALSAIAKRTSSYSNVATNSVSLDTGAQVFNASYVSGSWIGSVTARAISENGVSSTIAWTSSVPGWASRKIFTSNGTTGQAFPTSTQLGALARTGGPVDYPVTGTQNANYIRGDQSLEGPELGELRERAGLVGDIVGSSPAFVKDTNTLYVGANDGMLHAFDASNGRELFAYVPNILNIANLASLSHGDYSHKFFVDGPIAVSNRTLTTGKNILVGALGKGGKGLFALDVTAPADFGAGSFKWERAETPLNNMGLVIGKPILGKVPGGQSAVILGNGMNSTNEKAVLIVLDIETGAVLREINTNVGSTATPNGLSSPIGVYGQDGRTIAYAYAGDMLGNIWKFDLTANTATRLFTAVGPNGAQPISGGLAVATNPLTKKRWVFFGTGRFLTLQDADANNTAVHTMYGFEEGTTAYTRSDLTQRTITVTNATSSGYPVRGFQAKAPLPATSKGWYVDLPGSGERIVQDAQVVSSFLITASMITGGDACEPDGSGYINAVDAFTGTSAGGSYFDLNNDGSTDDKVLTGDLPIGSVNVGIGMPTLPNLLRGMIVVGGTGGSDLRSPKTQNPRWDRVSWREVRKD